MDTTNGGKTAQLLGVKPILPLVPNENMESSLLLATDLSATQEEAEKVLQTPNEHPDPAVIANGNEASDNVANGSEATDVVANGSEASDVSLTELEAFHLKQCRQKVRN